MTPFDPGDYTPSDAELDHYYEETYMRTNDPMPVARDYADPIIFAIDYEAWLNRRGESMGATPASTRRMADVGPATKPFVPDLASDYPLKPVRLIEQYPAGDPPPMPEDHSDPTGWWAAMIEWKSRNTKSSFTHALAAARRNRVIDRRVARYRSEFDGCGEGENR